jgi:RHS repeat-associated protein
VTKYEYDPYGNLVYASSAGNGNANPFRFSSKWFDAETGLYYYGYRYYSPRLGRWLSRDPIGERGGWNLMAFVGNRSVNRHDRLGLDTATPGRCGCKWENLALPNPHADNPCADCWQTCLGNQSLVPGSKVLGFVICRKDGCRCACLNMSIVNSWPNDYATAAIVECALKHEEDHVTRGLGKCPPRKWYTKCFSTSNDATGIQKTGFLDQTDSECYAGAVGITCLLNKMGGCGGDSDCRRRIIEQMNDFAYGCAMADGNVHKPPYNAPPIPTQ